MRTDVPYNLGELYPNAHSFKGYIYKVVSYHRNGTVAKSQWSISTREEVDLFAEAIRTNAIAVKDGWMIYFVNNQRKIVGKTIHNEESFIGRFRRTTDMEWHGYPGDYMRARSDIPPTSILQMWVGKYITKSQMSHIQRQQPCNL